MNFRFLAVLCLAILPACDCGDGRRRDAGPDGGPIPDAGVDGGDGAPDGGPLGRPCKPGDPCDDRIDCTVDSCDEEALRCRNVPDDHPCADEGFCNGDEVCDRGLGCVPGPPLACSDEDVCTIDSCDEETRECRHGPRDFDGDGHGDYHCDCATCDDCDDTNDRMYEGATEICGDEIDNDCNGLGEEGEEAGCEEPGYDFCSGALDVSGGGVFELEMGGTFEDYEVSCSSFSTYDAALVFTIDEAKDVEISAEGVDAYPFVAVALGSDCTDDPEADPPLHEFDEIECKWGFPSRLRRRGLEAGTYYVILASNSDADLLVDIIFSEATPAPANETCDDPIDVSAGGEWIASFVDITNDHTTNCGYSYPELVYEFTLAEPKDVIVAATADDARSVSVAVQTTCGVASTEVRCTNAAPAEFRLYSLATGTYYLLVESSSENEVTLEVTFADPTSPPPGDTCDEPISVSAGGSFTGDLDDMQDDYETGCGFWYRDEVYELVLGSTKDVHFVADASSYTYMSIRSDCDNEGTERRCTYGNPAEAVFRSLTAGSYYVLVESFRPESFDLDVTITNPATITDVSDNDLCDDTAIEIPVPGGGIYRGDTTGMGSDYGSTCGFGAGSPDAAFHFVLDEEQVLKASLEGSSYNTVLHLHAGPCATKPDLVTCQDYYNGKEAYIEATLDADSYYLVVDGFGSSSDGEYLLDVIFEDP